MSRRKWLEQLAGMIPGSLSTSFLGSQLLSNTPELFGGETIDSVTPYYIEVDLRDQWDFAHTFVPSGIGGYGPDLKRGDGTNTAALYFKNEDLIDVREKYNMFLTPESQDLKEHLDNIAIIETCELPIGITHGHEASNALRIPGRINYPKPGYSELWEEPLNEIPNMRHWGRMPNISCLHNFYHQFVSPKPVAIGGYYLNGFARPSEQSYHYPHDLPGARLPRLANPSELEKYITTGTSYRWRFESSPLKLTAKLAEQDRKFLEKNRFLSKVIETHLKTLHHLNGRLQQNAEDLNINLEMLKSERLDWGAGVPEQKEKTIWTGTELWHQLFIAHRMMLQDIIRTQCLAFDYVDIHGPKREKANSTMSLQFSKSIARFISQLKKDGLFSKTLIACFCVDGGRGARTESNGDEGKNSVILIGGNVKGGYYGDIRATGKKGDGHDFSYYAPDHTGKPRKQIAGLKTNENRISGAEIWLTMAKLMNLPHEAYPDLENQKPLSFLIRNSV